MENIEKLLEICNGEEVQYLVQLKSIDHEILAQKKRLFGDIVEQLMAIDEIPDELVEEYCVSGEFLSQNVQMIEELFFFKAHRLMFYYQVRRLKDAYKVLQELINLAPDSEFVYEWSKKLVMDDEFEKEQFVRELAEETDLSKYLDYLKLATLRYMVIVVACDTPWGPGFSASLTEKLLSIGLKINLYGRIRHSYGAIINRECCVFEAISSSEVVKWDGEINKVKIEIASQGLFPAKGYFAKIKIGELEDTKKFRGLKFIVYDWESQKVLDKVVFDTYADSLICQREAILEKKLAEWGKAHPDVGVLCFNSIKFPTENLSQGEQFIKENIHHHPSDLFRLIDHPKMPLREYYESKDDIIEVLTPPKSYHDIYGIRKFEDYHGKNINTIGGHRVTTGQPVSGKRTIYMVGGCGTFGVGAKDSGTIASYLQHLLNKKVPDQGFVVENYGYFLSSENARTLEEISILQALPVRSGDIILCEWGYDAELPKMDLSLAGERPHEYGEIFFDQAHCSENGYRMIADKLYERLLSENFFESKNLSVGKVDTSALELNKEEIKELRSYKEKLREVYDKEFSVGAIVMNCNPFTLGHRYLIEQAARQCGHLVIFVVEENLSFFPFEDRIKLVKEGTSDITNVTVLSSGKFMISSLTFAEYFNKTQLQNRVIDSSFDVNLFAREIAPCMHITKRFVGEEPYDTVTAQYNLEMKKVLPKFGIDVIEIPRKEYSGESISASRVRKYLKEKKFNEIKELVPPHTYNYLTKMSVDDIE